MDKTTVIIKPLITEKTNHQQNVRNTYAFEVQLDANKHQIKNAVESLYNVKVLDVRTQVRKGKPRRSRFKITTTSDFKRAIVVLDEASKIELF
jgi:large subunit ribosomal protein L23